MTDYHGGSCGTGDTFWPWLPFDPSAWCLGLPRIASVGGRFTSTVGTAYAKPSMPNNRNCGRNHLNKWSGGFNNITSLNIAGLVGNFS